MALLAILGADWHGPISFRKPALFGISGGVTVWSIAWLMTQLMPKRSDRWVADVLSIGLLIEVSLITVQYWRGVASHFNRTTRLDTAIEFTMLLLILIVTCGVFYLALRTFRLRSIAPSMAIAIRSGMWLLVLSCGLGIATSILGEVSITRGSSSEVWGKAGVLKFPHGVALHAIQLLPAIAWLAKELNPRQSVRIVLATLASQLLFLAYAVWQTSQGRDRFDWDGVGGGLLLGTGLSGMYPALTLAKGFFRGLFGKNA